MDALKFPVPDPNRSQFRAVCGVMVDFALGLALFCVAVGALSLGHGQAVAGSAGWITTVVPATSHLALNAVDVHQPGRLAAFVVLATTFAAITAFNLSIARHLRKVAVPGQHATDSSR